MSCIENYNVYAWRLCTNLGNIFELVKKDCSCFDDSYF